MKIYGLSLGTAILTSIANNVRGGRLPALLLVVLVGLLGIVLGEQLLPAEQPLLAGCDVPRWYSLDAVRGSYLRQSANRPPDRRPSHGSRPG
jgi:xanthosine utilization system XapX-like protein